MYQNCCKKCGSISLHTETKGSATGLYCNDCGAWVKWLGKDEKRAFEYAMRNATKQESEATNNYIENISKPTGVLFNDGSDILGRLNRFSDGIDFAIDSIFERCTEKHEQAIYNNAYAYALEKCKDCLSNVIEGREYNDFGKNIYEE